MLLFFEGNRVPLIRHAMLRSWWCDVCLAEQAINQVYKCSMYWSVRCQKEPDNNYQCNDCHSCNDDSAVFFKNYFHLISLLSGF